MDNTGGLPLVQPWELGNWKCIFVYIWVFFNSFIYIEWFIKKCHKQPHAELQQFTIKRVNNTKFDKKVIQITLKFDIRNFLIKENKGHNQFGNKTILLVDKLKG